MENNNLEKRVNDIEKHLNSSWLFSDSLFKRSLTVWWHIFIAYISVAIITLIILAILWSIWTLIK